MPPAPFKRKHRLARLDRSAGRRNTREGLVLIAPGKRLLDNALRGRTVKRGRQ